MAVEPYPLRFLRNLNRGREIATVLLNYGFGDLLERLGLLPYLQWGRKLVSRKPVEFDEEVTTAVRIRLAFQQLGPTFVKFGQVLSTRPDLIPPDVITELCKLQDDVPSFPGAEAKKLVEKELRRPIEELFRNFDDAPLAAGSLAQVHRATTHAGRRVVVKIRRPNAVTDVENDLSLMMELAQLLERHVPESKVFDPVGLVNHFTRSIRRELNFRREGRTMQEFARLFEGDGRLYVPAVEEDLSTEGVLTMEFIDGLKADHCDSILAARLDPAQVARDGAGIFLRQVFEMGIFHGDPHPGNIRVRSDGAIVLLDYGMVGFLDDYKREQLVDLFLAIAKHDVDRTVDLIQELGQAAQEIERPLLNSDVRDFIDAYYGIPLEQLNVGQLLTDFTAILANHGLRCPGDLMLLLRAIITLEGIGRQLDPDFNLANLLAPFIEKSIRQRYEPRRIAEKAFSDVRTLLQAAHDLPLSLGKTLKKVSQDELKVQLEHRGLEKVINEFDRSSNRIVVGLVTSSLVVATALIIRVGSTESWWFAVPLFLLSGLLGLWLIWGVLRSGRL